VPLSGKKQYPVSGEEIDYSAKPEAVFRRTLLRDSKALLSKRKLALRLGKLVDSDEWILRPRIQREIARAGAYTNPKNSDFQLNIRQKGVDMRLGIDIASLAYKKLVSQIILIAGDSDFVPAAKLARREGIDVIVDSLGLHIHESLLEHIDGHWSHWHSLRPPEPAA